MLTLTNNIKLLFIRFLAVAVSGLVIGFLAWRTSIFIPTHMAFQFTVLSVAAGLTYALLRHTSKVNTFLALFCWFIGLTIVEDYSNRWLYVLNLVYTAGTACVVYLYLRFSTKGMLTHTFWRILALAIATGVVNIVHLLVMVFIARGFSWFDKPLVVREILDSSIYNCQFGILVGLAAALAIEAIDHSLIRRASSAMKSWALDANGS
jgi:hypothetical protein